MICKIEYENDTTKKCLGFFCKFPIIKRNDTNGSPFNNEDINSYGLLCPYSYINEQTLKENNISLLITFSDPEQENYLISKKELNYFSKNEKLTFLSISNFPNIENDIDNINFIDLNSIKNTKGVFCKYMIEKKIYYNISKKEKLEFGTSIFYLFENELYFFGISDKKNEILPVFDFYKNFKHKIEHFDEISKASGSSKTFQLVDILSTTSSSNSSQRKENIHSLIGNYDDDIGIGLKNEGNTCYANSSMQIILHCNKLTKYIYKIGNNTNSDFISHYYKLIKKFLSGEKNYTIYHLLKIMSKTNPIFLDNRQHDPLEFINHFFTILNQELIKNNKPYMNLKQPTNAFESYKNNYFQKNNTIISLFIGFFKIITIFNNRKIESYTPFKSLDLPLINEKNDIIDNIYDSIKYLTKKKGNFLFQLEELPYNLIINLKRINNERHLNHYFDFPETIDFKEFLPKEYNKSTNYRLIGVLIHFGGGNGGHKIAVCKQLNLKKWKIFNGQYKIVVYEQLNLKKWKKFNDNSVSDVDENYIFNNEANVLLYEQI